jgi:hypothetical protein
MVESNHKKLVKRLRKSGKLSVYTKQGQSIPLNISGRKLNRKLHVKPENKQSLCGWLKKRHSKKRSNKRRNRNKRTRLSGGADSTNKPNNSANNSQNKNKSSSNAISEVKFKVDEDKMLSNLEKKIVEKLNSIGLNTNTLN